MASRYFQNSKRRLPRELTSPSASTAKVSCRRPNVADNQISSPSAHRSVNAIYPCTPRPPSIWLLSVGNFSADIRCLRADQKGKVRAAHGVRSKSVSRVNGREIVDDGMAFFWQCQASRAGKPECGGFKLLDIRAEGRGPCMGDEGPDVEDFDELSVKAEGVDAASATVERPVSDERKQEATLKPTREPERECKQETKQAFKQEPSPVIDQK